MWFWIFWIFLCIIAYGFMAANCGKDEKKEIENAVAKAIEAERLKHPPPPRAPNANYDVRNLSSEELLDIIEKRKDAQERARWR